MDKQNNSIPEVELPAVKYKSPEMRLIPEGRLIMGIGDAQIRDLVRIEDWAREWYDRDLFLGEQPQHIIQIQAFELAVFPVTNEAYYEFVWETGHRVPRGWVGFQYIEGMGQHPVVNVSLKDALAYIEWLNGKTGSNYRLPNEAEWERAARGDDDRLYPWGMAFDPWRCNTAESGKRSTTGIGEYSPGGDSPFGIMDMAGNVWEWTTSLLEHYPYRPDDGREDATSNTPRVIRGGAWYYTHKLARCTTRESARPNFLSPALGFRLARTP